MRGKAGRTHIYVAWDPEDKIDMTESDELFQIVSDDVNATGTLTDDGFLVLADSIIRKQISPSSHTHNKNIVVTRDRLLATNVLLNHDGQLRFETDHLFGSPSAAAGIVLGTSANGWTAWKRADGQTLSQVKRISRDPEKLQLDDATKAQILEKHQQLIDDGQIPSQLQLDQEYNLFRERFGPSVLANLDGSELLYLMHDLSNHDSLVYWLEFKNDEEFKTRRFGSIAGGSALKFRVFRRKETGNWEAGGKKANRPVDITEAEAIEYAKAHRDQLIIGAELLESLPANASDDDYAQLQDEMDELAPDVSRLAWGHKYFSLLFPDKLDDFHSPGWQQFILLKLLQLPPEGDGRYQSAGRFVSVAREVDLPITTLDTVLNLMHGGRHKYWRIGTGKKENQASIWSMMQNQNCIAIGWPKLGDLSWVNSKKESRKKLKALIEEKFPDKEPISVGNNCSQITKFIADLSEGDIVLAADGETILGIGRIVGDYPTDFR